MYSCRLSPLAIILLLGSFTAADDGAPAPLRAVHVEPDEIMNGKFTSAQGWIGADGVYSIPLPDDSILWVFGDTLIGAIREGKRHDLAMVNNTFARQRGWGAAATVQFFVNRDADGRARSFIVPDNKPGYYWLWDGIVEGGKLYLFTTRLTSPGTITAFDWTLLDQSLVVVENPLEEPSCWRSRQLEFPFGAFTESYEALWGMEVLKVDDGIYVYGTVQHGNGTPRELVVARLLPKDLSDFSRWTFYRDGEWQRDPRQAGALTVDVGTEGSITWLPHRQRYVYIYSPPLDPNIKMRTAKTPVGPWSEAVTIYACPEAKWDKRIFCYAGKARLVPGAKDQLLISYAANSFEMLPHVRDDARIYVPRFVKATLAD
jgi:hypothetical protein